MGNKDKQQNGFEKCKKKHSSQQINEDGKQLDICYSANIQCACVRMCFDGGLQKYSHPKNVFTSWNTGTKEHVVQFVSAKFERCGTSLWNNPFRQ